MSWGKQWNCKRSCGLIGASLYESMELIKENSETHVHHPEMTYTTLERYETDMSYIAARLTTHNLSLFSALFTAEIISFLENNCSNFSIRMMFVVSTISILLAGEFQTIWVTNHWCFLGFKEKIEFNNIITRSLIISVIFVIIDKGQCPSVRTSNAQYWIIRYMNTLHGNRAMTAEKTKQSKEFSGKSQLDIMSLWLPVLDIFRKWHAPKLNK